MTIPPRPEYKGHNRRLLLALDIGTTFSGISYSILDPGNVPEIRPVTRFPSQERVGGDTKIPTVIYYDNVGKPCAIGAETLKEGIEGDAEEYGWTKAHWFKLHLRPQTDSETKSGPVPPLPPKKTVIVVFADYMTYLLACAKTYISDTHGKVFWESLENGIAYVLTHPNGWGGPEQAKMRQAAILAGFVPDTEAGRARISFVTEGEASLHFCLTGGLAIGTQEVASGVLIVDAGGGTIDVTAYRRDSEQSFEEIAIPRCYFQGAIYVAMRAEKYFDNFLKDSRFYQDVPTIVSRFDRTTKHVFRREDEPHHIQFASFRERDPAYNIRGGRITVEGSIVASFFEPSISCIVNAIKVQQSTAHFPIKSVFLVGGFAASDWLYEMVKAQIEPLGIVVSRPDTHVSKAVSNGAVSYYLDGAVTSRVARSTYGICAYTSYVPTNEEHRRRSCESTIHSVTGKPVFLDCFSCILPKDTRVKETKEFRHGYARNRFAAESLNYVTVDVLCYTGQKTSSQWMLDEPDAYPILCTIEADTTAVVKRPHVSRTGQKYFEMSFSVVLLFGLTELKAQIAYIENGVEKRGPATVVYDGLAYDDSDGEGVEGETVNVSDDLRAKLDRASPGRT
ncbi:hypothetical protein D9611_003533 [Ephemerocybe angulata]|uniref:Uncharacterized protein n=1 Tax=Ephemerocybe angulata TaxID=980116 RepID=A0A8H5B6A2_9AGAR|nr:hypothetical protein D9611_003533 [Tulosesus angulatus]